MCTDHGKPEPTAAQQRALRNVRQLLERNQGQSGVIGFEAETAAIASVGIVGAGLMGVSIAAAHLRRDLPVVVFDLDPAAVASAPRRVAEQLSAYDPRQSPAPENSQPPLTIADSLQAVAACDLVVESIIESFPAKSALLVQIEPLLAEAAILVSNTSTIPIGRLGAVLTRPERFCGFHFCHPVPQRPLVEVVRGPKTSDQTVARLLAHARRIGRTAIVVRDGPGFVVNRLLFPLVTEALELLLEGVSIQSIEEATAEFGWSKGPLRLLDEIGLDIALQGGMVLSESFPERIAASPLMVAMVKQGLLGRKSGAGFFVYPDQPQAAADDTLQQPNPAAQAIIDRVALQWPRPAEKHTAQTILMRLLLPMVLEASRIIAENKVQDPRDIDLAAIFGLGFPEVRGGLLWWADTYGPTRLLNMLRGLERLGARMQPTPLLREMARRDVRFYQLASGAPLVSGQQDSRRPESSSNCSPSL